jgi:hypothetical protein
MSNLAVTGEYFEEPVDEDIVNGPKCQKTAVRFANCCPSSTEARWSRRSLWESQPTPCASKVRAGRLHFSLHIPSVWLGRTRSSCLFQAVQAFRRPRIAVHWSGMRYTWSTSGEGMRPE